MADRSLSAEPSSLLKKENQAKKIERFTVVKRNGSLVPFRRERIFRAIEAAFRDTKKIPKEHLLPDELHQVIEQITDFVIADLYLLANKGASLTVEGIQDQ